MKAHIITDMTEEEYHASSGIGPDKFLTRSMICDYDNSSNGFYLRHIVKHPLAQFNGSKSTDLGSMVEAVIDGSFDDKYAEPIPWRTQDRRTKAGKDSFNNWGIKNERHMRGRISAPADMVATAKLCIDQLRKSGPYGETAIMAAQTDAMEHGPVVRWTDEETGIPLQVRFDGVVRGKFFIDWKTMYKRLTGFYSSVDAYGYDLQDSLYSEAWQLATGELLRFFFGLMQTKYPFEASVEELDDEVKVMAKVRIRNALRGIKDQNWGESIVGARKQPVPFWWSHKYENLDPSMNKQHEPPDMSEFYFDNDEDDEDG